MQNKKLFSDNFLVNRLPQMAEWSEEMGAVFSEIRKLMQLAQRSGNAWNEAQTEEDFVKPVLRLLGWNYIVQPKARNRGQLNRPDYALFPSENDKNNALPLQGDDHAFYGRTLAISEAKYWGRQLSQRDDSGRETWKTGSNPSYQMVNYLVGTRVPWGILTNGQIWRLYSREVSSTASEFYEVDLGLIFDFIPTDADPSDEQKDAFRRWWLFFRKAAFVPGGQGKSFVQIAQETSTSYAREISEQLKRIVFEEVMPLISGGFVKYRREQQGIMQETPESLKEIYVSSLSLLYKLLFLLYAEARSLLPMENPSYRDNCLTNIARWASRQIDSRNNISDAAFATARYDALLALFHRVDKGDSDLGIPHYNGGLFNPTTHENQFLERHKLSDKTIALVIDRLVRDQGQSVDYAYISVRNLGSIYEGLLENKLNVLDASAGLVELVNDKGERKATGSYYTPDYVVEYIVRNTLDPILEARDSEYQKAMNRVSLLRKKLSTTVDSVSNRLLQKELTDAETEAREAFLGIKVLDPAMGSGHFLVNAVDHLTDGIIQRTQAYHDSHPEADPKWDPIQRMIDGVRAGILSEMADQQLSIDSRRLDDTSLLTRLVMKRCIYGVDLNPMAVELAKVSLWLHSFTIGAPLSFLDHHLRCGNSLIGTDVRSVESSIRESESGQISLFAGPFAGLLDLTATMTEVAERADATLADVHQSASDYASFQATLIPYKKILDIWVSQYFGNKLAYEFLTVTGDAVLPVLRGEQPVDEKYAEVIATGENAQKEKNFFHWDLEFPEVFVDLKKRDWAENAGFDAVIGNPPYVSAPAMVKCMDDERSYLSYSQSKYLVQKWDIYCAFMYKAWILLAKGCNYFGFIVPNQFFYQDYAKELRRLFAEETTITNLVDLGGTVVFNQVAVMPCIICFSKEKPKSNAMISTMVTDQRQITSLSGFLSKPINQNLFLEYSNNIYHLSISQSEYEIKKNIDKESIKLQDICYGSVGVVPHSEKFNKPKEDYIFQEKVNEKCKKYIEGKDAGRYYFDWAGKWLEYDYHVVRRPSLPELLESPKIALKIVAGKTGLNACYDNEKIYTDHSFVLFTLKSNLQHVTSRQLEINEDEAKLSSRYDLKYVLSLINSNLLNWYFKKFLSSDLNIGPDDAKLLPIHKINFQHTDEFRAKEIEKFKLLYETQKYHSIFDYSQKLSEVDNDLIHDQLAFLARQMVELNERFLAERNGFLSWLSRELSCSISDLQNKTILENYVGNYQKNENPMSTEQYLSILRKSQRLLNVNVSRREFSDVFASEYQSSLNVLLPIKSKLIATDTLINKIVYVLFGLSAKEIAIIEGSEII